LEKSQVSATVIEPFTPFYLLAVYFVILHSLFLLLHSQVQFLCFQFLIIFGLRRRTNKWESPAPWSDDYRDYIAKTSLIKVIRL
jgi:hypothetical protein